MMIKKRLVVSNILMLIIPVILILLIAISVLAVFDGIYGEKYAQWEESDMKQWQEIEADASLEEFTQLYAQRNAKREKEMKEILVACMGIIFIAGIVVVVVTNGILSTKVARSLIQPLELLRYSLQQIKEGNLDFKLNYEKKDEFEEVCSDFDEMRLKLKDSIEIQLKYEENRKQLVAGISHDLRTPLTAIKGYVEGLKDGIATTPEKQKKYLNTIHQKACDMDVLVDRLFLFSKLDTGYFPFSFQNIKIEECLQEFFTKAEEEFLSKGIQISYENGCAQQAVVKIDREEMARVLTNILENSAKYKDKALGRVVAELMEIEGNIVLTICDDGPGMPKDDLKNAFETFYRGDPSRTNPSGGSGLGLSIAKRIVEAHGGTIEAQSNDGEGLCIIITLPKVKEIDT